MTSLATNANPAHAQRADVRDVSLAVLCDYPEEHWPSMDLMAEMLLDGLHGEDVHGICAQRISPRYRRRLERMAPGGGWARNGDRAINRMIYYPRLLRRLRDRFECFHVCDHSYSQLLLELPGGRAGVFCHDLDTFRCLLEPRREPRPRWFRAIARRILRGMQKAAVIFVSSDAVRQQIVRHQLVDPAILVYAPPGVSPEFRADAPGAPASSPASLPASLPVRPYVLHVGSCIPRKRIDILLDAFALVRSTHDVTLLQVGGTWTAPQRRQILRRKLADVVEQRRGIRRADLAALYRRAGAVVITSEAEGFGLPMVEALACGTRVVASDIPALREVAGDAARYAPVGDVEAFAASIVASFDCPRHPDEVQRRLAQVRRFTWSAHAQIIAGEYLRIAGSQVAR